jgi:ribosomal protein S7
MASIEDVAPITLEKNDGFYASVEKLCDEMKKETVDVFKKSEPKKAREEFLRQQDTAERERMHQEEEKKQNERFKKIDKAMRSIEVVGQIIKNRRNTLEKCKLKEMLVELYYAGFRTVSYLGSTLTNDKQALIEDIVKDEKLGGDTMKIRDHINYFFELTTFRFCLFTFSKIINSVGVKELRWLYNDASKEIASPAAEIVTFSIESVYSKLAVDDLKKLVEKYKDNSAVMTIIRARVRSYLYNNYVEINDRKRIASALRLDEGNARIGNNTLVNTRRKL